jgi:hypothetical protein
MRSSRPSAGPRSRLAPGAILDWLLPTLRGVPRDAAYQWRMRVSKNPPSRARLRAGPPPITDAGSRILQTLVRHGIAVLSLADLGAEPRSWSNLSRLGDEMRAAVAPLLLPEGLDGRRLPPWLRHNAEKVDRFGTGTGRSDDYIVKRHPENPTLSLQDPLLRFALDPALLSVVDSYLGVRGRLIYTDLWHTLPAPRGSRIGSQRWHRDYDDARLMKVYLYFDRVDAARGAMQYVAGSQQGGLWRDLWPWRHAASRYVPEGELEAAIPESEWVTAAGDAGTLVLCDTSGLHRGGPSVGGCRLLATWTFVTPASLLPRRFRLAEGEDLSRLSPEARVALTDHEGPET